MKTGGLEGSTFEPPKTGDRMTVSILVATKIPSTVQISSPKPQIICENAQPKPRKPLKLQAFQAVSKSVGNATRKASSSYDDEAFFLCFHAFDVDGNIPV